MGAELRVYLWFVGVEHGHLHVLPPDVLGLPLHWRGRGFLVVPTDADEEEQQSYGQGNGDTWHQDVQDFHLVLFLGILVIWFRKGKKPHEHPTESNTSLGRLKVLKRIKPTLNFVLFN